MVVLLCLGVGFFPCCINIVGKASAERNTVEVTTEGYGIRGYGHSAVSLSEPQYEKLIGYLENLKVLLNATTSKDDTLRLFHEAVVEINTYGLLPDGMSVTEAQKLVSGYYSSSKMSSPLRNTIITRWIKQQGDFGKPFVKNYFCLLFATATKIPQYQNPGIIPLGILLVVGLFPALIVSNAGQMVLANKLAELGLSLWLSNPFRWLNFVFFEGYNIEFQSLGLKGLVNDALNPSGAFRGFTGLMLSPFNGKTYFLGFAFGIYSPPVKLLF